MTVWTNPPQTHSTHLEHGVEDKDDEDGQADEVGLGPQRRLLNEPAQHVLAQQHYVERAEAVPDGAELVHAGVEEHHPGWHVGRDDDEEDGREAEEVSAGTA